MAAEKEYFVEIPIKIKDVRRQNVWSSPFIAPTGKRIARWDALEFRGKTTGSVTVTVEVHQGKESESVDIFNQNDFKAGLGVSGAGLPSVAADANFHLQKKLNNATKSSHENYTLKIVANVEPLKKGVFEEDENVNLDAVLRVYLEPIPELANQNPAIVEEMQPYRTVNKPKLDNAIFKENATFTAGNAEADNVPEAAASELIAAYNKTVEGGVINAPSMTQTTFEKRVEFGASNLVLRNVGPTSQQSPQKEAQQPAPEEKVPHALKDYMESPECKYYKFDLRRTGRCSMLIKFTASPDSLPNSDPADVQAKLIVMEDSLKKDLRAIGLKKNDIKMTHNFKDLTLTIASADILNFNKCLDHIKDAGEFSDASQEVSSVFFKASAHPPQPNNAQDAAPLDPQGAPEIGCSCQ